MARSKNGEAISARRRSPSALKKLRRFIRKRQAANDLDEWRRGQAVLGYLNDRRVVDLAADYGVTRGSVNRWLQWYEAAGIDGLRTEKPPGPSPKLDAAQRDELGALIDAGPLAAGYQSGVWTGPMIGDLIEQRFNTRYHKHNVPRLLHDLGFPSNARGSGWHALTLKSRRPGSERRSLRLKKSPRLSRTCDVRR